MIIGANWLLSDHVEYKIHLPSSLESALCSVYHLSANLANSLVTAGMICCESLGISLDALGAHNRIEHGMMPHLYMTTHLLEPGKSVTSGRLTWAIPAWDELV